MKPLRTRLAVIAAAVIVSACGGGDGPDYSKLVAFGDSLTDVGTYRVGSIAALGDQTGGAGRWTVNAKEGGQVWVERVARELDVDSCPAETGLSPNIPGLSGAPVTAHPGCTNYAQGSSRVSSPLGPNSVALQAMGQTTLGLTAKPVKDQMAAHLTASGGSYSGEELVVVAAGANDVFMELQLTAPTSPQQAVANLGAAGAELGALIKSQVLGKGAKRVVVMNVPHMGGTPFVRGLDAPTQGLIDNMIKTFNSQLASALNGVAGVRVIDVYTRVADEVANPAKYGLSNVTDVACGPNALSSPATAPGSSLVCNASNLLAGDRSRYLFADSVHPTPYGHRLMADFVLEELDKADWR